MRALSLRTQRENPRIAIRIGVKRSSRIVPGGKARTVSPNGVIGTRCAYNGVDRRLFLANPFFNRPVQSHSFRGGARASDSRISSPLTAPTETSAKLATSSRTVVIENDCRASANTMISPWAAATPTFSATAFPMRVSNSTSDTLSIQRI